MLDVAARAGEEIVRRKGHFASLRSRSFTKMRAQKTGTSGDQHSRFQVHVCNSRCIAKDMAWDALSQSLTYLISVLHYPSMSQKRSMVSVHRFRLDRLLNDDNDPYRNASGQRGRARAGSAHWTGLRCRTGTSLLAAVIGQLVGMAAQTPCASKPADPCWPWPDNSIITQCSRRPEGEVHPLVRRGRSDSALPVAFLYIEVSTRRGHGRRGVDARSGGLAPEWRSVRRACGVGLVELLHVLIEDGSGFRRSSRDDSEPSRRSIMRNLPTPASPSKPPRQPQLDSVSLRG